MSKPKFEDIKKLYTDLVFPFYQIQRDMDLPLKKRRKENDAEHSWTLTFIACTLADRIDSTLDIGKLAQLGIVHDLVEVYAGDTTIWDAGMVATKEKREAQALVTIKKEFAQFPWIGRMVEDYEHKKSKESKFLWAVDKYVATTIRYLDVSEAGGEYFIKEVPRTKEEFLEGIAPTRKKAHAHPEVGKYYDEVLAKLAANESWFSPN